MPFINTQGLILIGPGSEWFWNAVSGLILAGTFIAVYRQLRLQANATATGQLTEFEREWTSERLRRFQLAVLRELQAGVDPASLSGGSPHVVFDFWERIGALARRGRNSVCAGHRIRPEGCSRCSGSGCPGPTKT